MESVVFLLFSSSIISMHGGTGTMDTKSLFGLCFNRSVRKTPTLALKAHFTEDFKKPILKKMRCHASKN
jgi:hypothetical protein